MQLPNPVTVDESGEENEVAIVPLFRIMRPTYQFESVMGLRTETDARVKKNPIAQLYNSYNEAFRLYRMSIPSTSTPTISACARPPSRS